MSSHEYFERLGVLAALGEISGTDAQEWEAHVRFCEPCQAAYEEHARVLRQVNEENLDGSRRTLQDDACRERFLARARARGIHFSEEARRGGAAPKRVSMWLLAPTFAASVAIVALAAAGISSYQGLKQRIKQQRASITGLTGEISSLSSARNILQARLAEEAQSKASLESEFSSAQRARGTAIARANRLEQQLMGSIASADALQAQMEKSGARAGDLQRQLQADERRLADLGAEVRNLRAASTNHTTTAAALNAQVDKLSAQLQSERETNARYRQLLAAGKDIRNLMGARKLHVIDVFDADGEGDNSKVFGRVFYTEGRSLVFYAFDLGRPNNSSGRVSYVAWGEKADAATPAKELGIFYMDDINQRRWVLRFDNPKVLRQINAVFVTIEHDNVSQRPTGQTLLYAYLDTPANHP